MSWHDFFYFSKGERTGLIVLLSIIVIAITVLTVTRQTEPAGKQKPAEIAIGSTVSEDLSPKDTTSSVKISSGQSAADQPAVAVGEAKAGQRESSTPKAKESVSERVNRLTSYSQPAYQRTEKFTEGTIVELNTADTTILKKVPGIGSAFAKRIVGYRALLGGYYSVTQLGEVYGIDEDRYQAFIPWFTADPSFIKKLEINTLPQDSLPRHPYISYAQARVIRQLRRQKGKLTGWENLQLLNEFTESDKTRLQPYISFE